MGLILVILLVLILLGGVGGPYFGAPWPHAYGFGGSGLSVVGLVLIILVGAVADWPPLSGLDRRHPAYSGLFRRRVILLILVSFVGALLLVGYL